jgi:hypothetical protein
MEGHRQTVIRPAIDAGVVVQLVPLLVRFERSGLKE